MCTMASFFSSLMMWRKQWAKTWKKHFFSSKWLKKLWFDLKRKNNFDIPNIPNHQRLWGQEFVIAFLIGYKNEVIFCQTNIYDSKAKVRNELSPANTMNSILFSILAIWGPNIVLFVVKHFISGEIWVLLMVFDR